jgi:hypothetical protein
MVLVSPDVNLEEMQSELAKIQDSPLVQQLLPLIGQ